MDYQFEKYQPAARAAIKAARESGQGKALLVMSGGLGKTIVAADDVADFLANSSGRVLVLCHDPSVLEQSRKKFRARLGEDYSLGIFHGKEKTFRRTDVLFVSFQILQEHFGWIEQFAPTDFDYIIVDEAHHSRAITYEKVINYFQPKFILGLTATPYREDGKPLDDIFGSAVYQLDYATALSNGYLTPVNYYLMTYEISRINEVVNSNEKFSLSALNERIKTAKSPEELIADVQARLKAHHDPRTVVFCSSIEDVETFSGLLEGSLPLHSKLGLAEQESNLEKFRNGETRTLVVMNMLNEGVDVPEIDVAIRLRPTNSRVLFQQQLFRGARISPDKEQFVVYDYVTNAEQLQILLEFAQQVEANRSQSDGDRPCSLRDEPFKVTISGGTWHARIVDLEQILSRVNQYLIRSDEEYLELLRNFYYRLGHLPSTKEITAAEGMPCARVYSDHFGSLEHAFYLAGIGPEPHEYTKEELISILQNLSRRLGGKVPSSHDINDDPDSPSVSVFISTFGSIAAAQAAAGFKPYGPRISLTREQILEKLVAFTRANHRPPASNELQGHSQENDLPSLSVVLKAFGIPYSKMVIPVIKAAMAGEDEGVIWDYREHLRSQKRQAVLEAYVEFAKQLGRRPSKSEIEEADSLPSATGICSLFGNLQGIALAAQAYIPDIINLSKPRKNAKKPRVFTHERYDVRDDRSAAKAVIYSRQYKTIEERRQILIDDLRRKVAEIGHVPTRREFNSFTDVVTSNTYRNEFGSWNNALRLAGFTPHE